MGHDTALFKELEMTGLGTVPGIVAELGKW